VSRLVFSPTRHTYSLDGEWVPGVTSIVRRVTPNDGLISWAAREAAAWAAINREHYDTLGEVPWREQAARQHIVKMEAGGRTGKQVHSIAQRLIRGEPVEPVDPDTGEPYSDDVSRMGERVAEFLDRWDVDHNALVERPVFHEELRYAGTLDLCGILRGGDRWLIDYKSSPSGPWHEASLQLTAYSRATHIQIGERDLLMPPIQRCAVLWVRPDAWELIPVKSDDDAWAAFCAAIPLARWLRQKREQVIGAALPVPESEPAA